MNIGISGISIVLQQNKGGKMDGEGKGWNNWFR